MATKNDGGSAFPVTGEGLGTEFAAPGMSLRDYFAAHENSVPTQEWALWYHGKLVTGKLEADQLAKAVAAWRYKLADAMIAEREKP